MKLFKRFFKMPVIDAVLNVELLLINGLVSLMVFFFVYNVLELIGDLELM
jgi:hypothetical protein